MSLTQSLLAPLTMLFTVTQNTLVIVLGALLTIAATAFLSIVVEATIQWLDQHFDDKKDEKDSSAQKNEAKDGSSAPGIAAFFSAFGYAMCLALNIDSASVVWMVVNSCITMMGIALGLTLAALMVVGLVYGVALLGERFGKL